MNPAPLTSAKGYPRARSGDGFSSMCAKRYGVIRARAERGYGMRTMGLASRGHPRARGAGRDRYRPY